jgi:hypothetical protein
VFSDLTKRTIILSLCLAASYFRLVIVEADKSNLTGAAGGKPQRGFVVEDTPSQPTQSESKCCGGN